MNRAIDYLNRGFSIMPLSKDKRPLLKTWKQFQTTHPSNTIVKYWWTQSPDANVGIITGRLSNLTVIDVDGNKGGFESLKKLGISSQFVVVTGNGLHLYFQFNEKMKTWKEKWKKELPGLDVRSEGGYVMAPPSIHPNGRRYLWKGINIVNYPILPRFPIEKFQQLMKDDELAKQPDWISQTLSDLKSGSRHQQFATVIGKLNTAGVSPHDIIALLTPYANSCNFDLAELEDQVNRMCKLYAHQAPQIDLLDSHSLSSFLEMKDEVSWIVSDIIAEQCISFIAGLPESLKSWMLIDLAIECARKNGLWLNKFPTAPCKVLYIDQERFKGETKRRFSSLIKAKNIDPKTLDSNLLLKCGTTIRLDLQQSYEAFRKELERTKPGLVLVDSFVTFHTKEDNTRKETQEVMEKIKALRNEFGCSFVFIDHETKGVYQKEKDGEPPSLVDMIGSVAKSAATECVLTVRKESVSTSMVYHTKSTLSPTVSPFLVKISDQTDDRTKIKIEAL